MRIEAVRCCCLRLRPALIIWGYLKLVLISFLLLYFSAMISLLAVCLLAVAAVLVLHIIFVIGARKKGVQFLMTYHFYSLTLLVLTCLLGLVYTIVIKITTCALVYSGSIFIYTLVFSVAIFFVELPVQAHIFRLVRSEIVNYNKCGVVTLFNIPVEAERSLNTEDRGRRKEEVISTGYTSQNEDLRSENEVV